MDLSKYTIKKTEKKIDHEFQALGLEIQLYFQNLTKRDKNALWSSFYRIPMDYHRQALKVCQERGIKSIRYFWGVVNNLKKKL